MQENDLFDKFSEFPYVVYIQAVIPDTYIVFCRTIIQCVLQIENLPPQHLMGRQRKKKTTTKMFLVPARFIFWGRLCICIICFSKS